MSSTRIFITLISIIVVVGALTYFFTSAIAPTTQDMAGSADDLTRPRAPSEAKAIKNPAPNSKEAISNGKALFQGKGNCYVCHGLEGKGDGEGGQMLRPRPRDLTDPQFQRLRTDGELFWTIKFGVPDTGMFPSVPRQISEEEAWMVVRYIRTLGEGSPGNEGK